MLPLPGGVVASLVDLPGTYSLNARSAEEQIAFDALTASPDAVIVCLDATQLARSAYLLAQIQELGERCVVALTMVDEAKDATPDVPALRALLGCEVVAVTARTGRGLAELRAAIDRALRRDGAPVWRWTPSAALRTKLDAMRSAVPSLDDARALWALPCIDGEDGLEDGPVLRAAALADRIDREQDEEGVLARWARVGACRAGAVTHMPREISSLPKSPARLSARAPPPPPTGRPPETTDGAGPPPTSNPPRSRAARRAPVRPAR